MLGFLCILEREICNTEFLANLLGEGGKICMSLFCRVYGDVCGVVCGSCCGCCCCE